MSQFVGYDATENDARVELDVLPFHSETDGIVVVDAGQIGTDRKTEDVRPQTMLGRRRKYPQHDVCRLKRWRTRFFRTGGGRRAFHPDYPQARSIENPASFVFGCGKDTGRDVCVVVDENRGCGRGFCSKCRFRGGPDQIERRETKAYAKQRSPDKLVRPDSPHVASDSFLSILCFCLA